MNTTIKTFPYTDELMDEYNRLAMMNEIPNMATYALQWELLATKASGSNRPALAAHAHEHAEHYKQYDKGEYIKLVEGPLAELIFVSPA
jgi:hypothetical protein